MKIQSLNRLSQALRPLRISALALALSSACTVEHLDIGTDRTSVDENICPNECPVPDLCKLCEGTENTCADAQVSCNDDGSCGKITWVCPQDPSTPPGASTGDDPTPTPPGATPPGATPNCSDQDCTALCAGKAEPDVSPECAASCDCDSPPANCECDLPLPALCKVCDDGSCAQAEPICNPDGTCDGYDMVCPTSPSEPTCPDPVSVCDAQCNNEVVDVPPECPVAECDCKPLPNTCECAVPDICNVCPDGSCASPNVSCDASGECQEITWLCGNEPPEPTPDCNCAVDGICLLCSDGSCAEGQVACNEDGTCGDTTWACSNQPALYDCDVSNVGCELAINCEPGTVPTRNGSCYGSCVAPEQCLPQVYDCDTSQVLCKRAEPVCENGTVPSQVEDCYGPCVAPEMCAPPTTTAECPSQCAAPAICELCPDDSCASPVFSCNDDGSCGALIEWACP